MTPTDAERLERWKRIAEEQAEQKAKYDVLEQERAGTGQAVALGDIVSFKDTGPGIWWVVVRQHAQEEDYWMLVPADTVPLVGSRDVAVQTGFGSLSLRFRLGTWAPESDIVKGVRAGVLNGWDSARAQQEMQDIWDGVYDNGYPCLSAEEADADPVLIEWLAELRAACSVIYILN